MLQRDCYPQISLEVIERMIQQPLANAAKDRGLGVVVQACDDSTLYGFAQMTIWPRIAEISDLMVAEPYRNVGIGSAMIRYLEDVLRKRNYPRVEIGAALSNPRAIALYRRLGFVDERIVDLDFGRGPEPVLYLLKILA
jgi:ribosomal protein S18 acetylase RimI-like enzyme